MEELIMNYTKTIREFCLQNKGDLFDVSYMKDKYFEMVPYKTLLKILNRLEEEKILTCVSKGVFLICKEGRSLEDAIEERYVEGGRGMFAGYSMFNDLEITDYYPDYNEIYRLRKSILDKFPEAFIIAFRQDKKMNVQEAIREFKKR